jgi:CubicO group peptidase (beta-lactamase class C family)
VESAKPAETTGLAALVHSVADAGPGCAYSVRRGGALVDEAAEGFRDLDRSAALSPRDRFDIGSVSKSFTAAVILDLDHAGLLSLNDPVSAHIDRAPAWGASVTIGDLLYMRSGVPEFLIGDPNTAGWRNDALYGSDITLDEPATADQILDAIRAMDELEFEPGSQYAYSNSNYVLLRAIAERASGRAFGELVARVANKVAGIETRFADVANEPPSAPSPVRGHDLTGDGGAEPFLGRWDVLGASGVWISAHDLARWAEGLLSDTSRLAEQSRLGVESASDEDNEEGYAAGLMTLTLDGEPIVYHLGGTEGFSSGMFLRPDHEEAMAFTCNMSPDLLFARGLGGEQREAFERFGELVYLHAWLDDEAT